MKYLIAHLLSGDARAFHERITRELARRYHTLPLSERIPPHITVKPPFEADNERIKEVERILRAFAKGERAAPLTLSGFGHFGFRTIYVDVSKSPEAVALARRTLKILNGNAEWIPKNPLEGNKLHTSIARFLTRRQSRHIQRYLGVIESPRFETFFDNLAILKKDGPGWELHTLIPLTLPETGFAYPLPRQKRASKRHVLV